MKSLLQKIVERQYCIGCGLCASIAGPQAIEMGETPAGFRVPRQKIREIDLSFLKAVCPGISLCRNPATNGPQLLFGAYQSIYAGHSTDEAVRWKASSGGMITALLLYMLEHSLIDGVLHAGVEEGDPLRSCAGFSRTREEVIRRAGSRYAPCSLLENWEELMRSGKKIAVVGKPCDIAAVSQYLCRYPERAAQVVCRISFLCMGLPSQAGTRKLIETMGIAGKEIRDFWYRGKGWPGQATATTADGRHHELSYDESWGKVLSKHVHFRCKICPDGFGGFADLSCGDAWFLQGEGPCFDERPGRSLMFVRTDAGAAVLRQAIKAGYLQAGSFDAGDVEAIQPSQVQRRIYVGARLAALKLFGDRLISFSGFRWFASLRRGRMRGAVLNFWGMLQRRWKLKGRVVI